jgi:DNA/RNA endonuclease G (NUC1)
MEQGIARRIPVGAVRHWRRMPDAIAVMMPNDSNVKGSGWKSFRVSVDLVERETGLNFLSNVPSQVQQIIESKVDSQ